jgi:hypothetical protein
LGCREAFGWERLFGCREAFGWERLFDGGLLNEGKFLKRELLKGKELLNKNC